MLQNRPIFLSIIICLFCQISFPSYSQLGISFDIKKPKQYEDRVLGSEKSDQKKFNTPRRFIQNTVTHYNYFFNTNNKLNQIIADAKTAHIDDYSQLLSFYNYSLDATAQNKTELDSVIIKSQTGIVLHDLRNDWIDDMYLLWGAAYYLRQNFDSAYNMFQFINYAFAEKEKDGYYKYIGSRLDGNNALTISTKENAGLVKRMFSDPPIRNQAFIWQIRTFIAQGAFTEAASLIETLKKDPVFPNRLKKDLEEVQALWFYKREIWDSAAFHLTRALNNATNKQEQARWEYLAAQLYERSDNFSEAERYYSKAIGHTTDPVMEIFARLNAIKTNTDSTNNMAEKNISDLLKMARREKYRDYRDIIYFMAAQMEINRNNVDGAYALLLKATKYSGSNETIRNKAFLQAAELAFNNRMYRQAYNFYDSLRLNDPQFTDLEKITNRKTLLGKLASQIETIERQDSLQHLAGLPEEERNDIIKDLVKKIRRQQGLKDDATFISPGFVTVNNSTDIFNTGEKGEWYFYNASLRTKGAIEFKSRWGNRPNTDNWRRSGVLKTTGNITSVNFGDSSKTNKETAITEMSFDALLNNLPLTEEKMKTSNDSVQNAMFMLGKLYLNELQDCAAMTEILENLRSRFPSFAKMDEVIFDLYYCTNKSGNAATATQLKNDLVNKYPNSNYTTIVTTGKNPADKIHNQEATKTYENIYDLFIEGNFSEALQAKKKADSSYGESYWTPQQMYIEAVYYVKQRQDSAAIAVLKNLEAKHKDSPLAEKATNLINVLGRRNQIEEELRNLQVERPADEIITTDILVTRKPVIIDSAATQPQIVKKEITDSTINKRDSIVAKPFAEPEGVYNFNPDQQHIVMIILNKVDPVFVNEAKTAMYRFNREKYYNKTFDLNILALDAENKLLIIGPFENAKDAVDYVQRAKPVTSTQIMPWLKADKYSYSIISGKNLELLKTKNNIADYKKFLEQHLPGVF